MTLRPGSSVRRSPPLGVRTFENAVGKAWRDHRRNAVVVEEIIDGQAKLASRRNDVWLYGVIEEYVRDAPERDGDGLIHTTVVVCTSCRCVCFGNPMSQFFSCQVSPAISRVAGALATHKPVSEYHGRTPGLGDEVHRLSPRRMKIIALGFNSRPVCSRGQSAHK